MDKPKRLGVGAVLSDDPAAAALYWQQTAQRLAREHGEMVALLGAVTGALHDADMRYHECFQGDDAAMKAYRQPQWERLVQRARALLARIGATP